MTLRSLVLVFSLLFFSIGQVRADVGPRVKALGAMAAYGTVGGALLGTASLAFGASGRAVAKGASIGLYAGLLFGGYVVMSHAYKKHQQENPQPQENYYPGVESPYEDGGAVADPDAGYYWMPARELELEAQQDLQSPSGPSGSSRFKKALQFYVPVFNISF